MNCCMQIKIKGIVQGVGFRPFIFNLAKTHNLLGYVLNNTSGVSIEVEGKKASIETFIEQISAKHPVQAVIFSLKSEEIPFAGYSDFCIRQSDDQEEKFVPISPEIATCKDCLKEIADPEDRRYRYPFTNCTNCGPRFTIVKDIPYDRKFTTMAPFIMCERCQAEYDNPEDRRFHAQPNACPECGPQLSLLDNKGEKIECNDIIKEVCGLLKGGKILAIKGIGGYHLACDAKSEQAVSNLRKRKYREFKPFALMVNSVDKARQFCKVTTEDEAILSGTIRPIVLLEKEDNNVISKDVSPNQKYHGVMLPYTPLHNLIVEESGLILVMTSGNISSEPIVYHDKDGLKRLKSIADYYLIHDRKIHIRTDDSVTRVFKKKEQIIRRSRGYAPFPLIMPFEFKEKILACGAELKNTFCLTRDNFAFMSHHIGDLENVETLTSFEQGIDHFKNIFNIKPEYVAYDLHPGYLSTKYALALQDISKTGVQHHHAHIAACMGENDLEGELIGVSFDGTGFGTDGKIWGGEFLICSRKDFTRAVHIEYMPLPGGEKAIKEPWRIAAAYLNEVYDEPLQELDIEFTNELDFSKWEMLEKMISKNINSPLNSSAGRLFDAVSALIGVRKNVYYEGQAAIELEMIAADGTTEKYPFDFKTQSGQSTILLSPLFKSIVRDIQSGIPNAVISMKFHNTLANMIVSTCSKLKKETGFSRVCLSGGVFQNLLLLTKTIELLEKGGFSVYIPDKLPLNDGGLALGQAIVANQRIVAGELL
ncbi:MAG: carbamoyltransferase HypF [Pseudomonadota bacterium]